MDVWTGSALIAGVAVLGFNANETIQATGGYSTSHALLTMAAALALGIAACCLGRAYQSKRRAVFFALLFAVIAMEAWTFLTTGERIVNQRDALAEPARIQIAHRHAVEARVSTAKQAVPVSTPRLDAALRAKQLADGALISDAAEKSCASNCRQLLSKAVDEAAQELTVARHELKILKSKSLAVLAEAEAEFAALPPAKTETPFADRLGLPGWGLDLIMAALKSIGVNGLGGALLAFGAHSKRKVGTEAVAAPALSMPALPKPAKSRSSTKRSVRDARVEASQFAATVFRPATDGRIQLGDIHEAYLDWCRVNAIEPLPVESIGGAMNKMFQEVGLHRDGKAILGIKWAPSELKAIAHETH